MNEPASASSYKRHRFPPAIIGHAPGDKWHLDGHCPLKSGQATHWRLEAW